MSASGKSTAIPATLPVLPLRNVVVYPNMVIPLFVGRGKSINALDAAKSEGEQVLLVAQRNGDVDAPTQDDIYPVGTLANILQLMRLPDGTIKVLVEGIERVWVTDFVETDQGHYQAEIEPLSLSASASEEEQEALVRSLVTAFEQYVKLNKKIPSEALSSLTGLTDSGEVADKVATHMALKLDQKQKVLEATNVSERLGYVLSLLEAELDLIQVEKRVRGRVKQQMEQSQREYYLNEQMKAIQKELGDLDDAPSELDALSQRIDELKLPAEADKKAKAELNKLKQMSPMSAEATVVRNYLDTVLDLPWSSRSRIKSNLNAAESVLAEEHFALDKVKARIIEYLAVQKRVKKLKGPILCLVGPPGVGKTSLGRSIAKATGRKFARIALGGVKDESEIRGHRRTYIGSMPGKIVQSLSKVETKNPLILLDEIDKMAADFRGDPAAALLEVLDPEQNHTFVDHYLELEFDLSDVMFIATANSMDIPPALLDRMEVIRIPGYTEQEKLSIATEHLLGRKMKDHGLKEAELELPKEVILEIIRRYTREAGVRNLERELAKICRKVVKRLVTEKGVKAVSVDLDSLDEYLGVPAFRHESSDHQERIGQVTGLAWTQVGGELLTIESAVMPGKGKLLYTGKLGDVMQESIQAAMTVVRSRCEALGLVADFNESHDVHVHVPEGATPKDGPSAGIGMCTALVSALTKIPVCGDIAMTGEITLRGEVLPIGGLKEKLLAAHRGRIKRVIIPEENTKDLAEVPEDILNDLEVYPVRWIDEVLSLALTQEPLGSEVEGVGRSEKSPVIKNTVKPVKREDKLRAH